MKVVWNKGPLYASDIVDTVSKNHNWHPKTVRTLLARLVQKGVVGFKKEGRAYVYDALKSEPDCVRDESETFLKRVFRGDLNSLFSYFIQKRKLSASQLSELRRLVRSK